MTRVLLTRTQAWRRPGAGTDARRRRFATPSTGATHEPTLPRPHPAHPGPADDLARHQGRRCCATGARGTPPSTRVTADVRAQAPRRSSTARTTHVCVPMQGSGTFSVEAAVNTLVPRDGHVLVLINGAYGTRMAKLDGDDGPPAVDLRDRRGRADDAAATSSGCSPPTRRSRTSASSTARPRPASSIRCPRSPPSSRATAGASSSTR